MACTSNSLFAKWYGGSSSSSTGEPALNLAVIVLSLFAGSEYRSPLSASSGARFDSCQEYACELRATIRRWCEWTDHFADGRQSAQFDVEEMNVVWAGSRQALEVSDRISRIVARDPVGFSTLHPNLLRSLPLPPRFRVVEVVMLIIPGGNIVCRPSRGIIEPCILGKSCSGMPWEKLPMPGNWSLGFGLQVEERAYFC